MKRIRMMSFNVRMGCGLKDPFLLPKDSLGHLPECAKVINGVKPDWVAIQEIDYKTDRAGGVDQTAELARLTGMNGSFVRKTVRTGGYYGLAILTKEAPISVSKILLPDPQHTRCLEIVEMKDYFIACTHFPLTAENALVAAKVVRLNLEDRDKPVFLAGDLNSLPQSEVIAELENGLTLLSDTAKPTFPADNPDRTIDYIFVDKKHSDQVKPLTYEVIAAPEATDHCALVLTAELE